jgi:hypothetical protein
MARTIQSPGVEINEIDLSLRADTLAGTSIFVAGFSDQGPIDEVLEPTSLSEFQDVYGLPTNAAERYFHHTVKNILNTSNANVTVSRLPYGEGRGDGFSNWRYSALAYPVKPVLTTLETASSFDVSNVFLTLSGYGYVTAPEINIIGNSGPSTVVTAEMVDDGTGAGTFSISQIILSNIGTGYTGDPVVIVGKSYIVNTLFVTESGSGYSSAPDIAFSGNAAETAVAIANLADDGLGTNTFGISSVTLVSPGLGYTEIPRVTLINNGDAPTIPATLDVFYADGSAQVVVAGTSTVEDVYVTNTNKPISDSNVYFFGKPTHLELSAEEYQNLIEGSISWQNEPVYDKNAGFTYETLGNAGMIVLNKSQTTINNKFEGYYVGFADNNNFNPATDFNSILSINSIQSNNNSIVDYIDVPTTRLNFALSADKTGNGFSLSEVMENLTNYDMYDESYNDTLSLAVFKVRQSTYSNDSSISLDYSVTESYVGSLNYHRQKGNNDGSSASSFFLSKETDPSSNISVHINTHLSSKNSQTWVGSNGITSKKVRFLSHQLKDYINTNGLNETEYDYAKRTGGSEDEISNIIEDYGYADAAFPLGVYSNTVASNKVIGHVPSKLERALELVENSDVFRIDLAVEAGLGTVYVNAVEQSQLRDANGGFDDSVTLKSLSSFYITNFDGLDENGSRIRDNYTSVSNVLINVAEKERKDFLVILDPIRNIFVQGENSKIVDQKKIYSPNSGTGESSDNYVTSNFSQHIYWPLRHQFGTTNCSYATTYANWVKVSDATLGRQVWVPFSGVAAGLMASTDSNFQPWYAPAGFTRGIVSNANDLALYPKQKQRDQLYKISLNPIAFFPNEGFVVFGQKTLLKKPSAFDRINVRRLFLTLEKITKNTAKYFVFEPNTLFTRTQVVNVLTPIFENAKNTEGLYDYRIVCSELNNTPDVIDNNELKIDIYIQPVRTAEFILVNFYATRTGTNFDELIGG